MFFNIPAVYLNQFLVLHVSDAALVIFRWKFVRKCQKLIEYIFRIQNHSINPPANFDGNWWKFWWKLMQIFHIQVSGSKIWQMERSCMCCQESGEREAAVSLFCPKAKPGERKFRKVNFWSEKLPVLAYHMGVHSQAINIFPIILN